MSVAMKSKKSAAKWQVGKKYREGLYFVLVTAVKGSKVWGRTRIGASGRYQNESELVNMDGLTLFEPLS